MLGTRGNPILRDRANQVFLDPQSLEPIKVQRSENISWVAWLNEIADPLHFGFFGGFITKLIWFAFGLALTCLSISGVYLTWKRLKTKTVSRTQFATLPVLLLTLLGLYFYWYPLFKTPIKPVNEIAFTHKTEHQFSVEIYFNVSNSKQLDGTLRLLATANGASPNIKDVQLELNKGDTSLGEPQKIKLKSFGNTSLYKGKLKKNHLLQATEVVAKIELNSGEFITTRWPMPL